MERLRVLASACRRRRRRSGMAAAAGMAAGVSINRLATWRHQRKRATRVSNCGICATHAHMLPRSGAKSGGFAVRRGIMALSAGAHRAEAGAALRSARIHRVHSDGQHQWRRWLSASSAGRKTNHRWEVT